MGRKKIQTILAMSAMVGAAPLVAHHATKQNNVVLESNTNPYFVNKVTGGLTDAQGEAQANNSNIKEQKSNNKQVVNKEVKNSNNEANLAAVNTNVQPITEVSKINYKKDLQVVIANVSMQKVVSGNTTTDSAYKPSTSVPSTGNTVTSGTIVTYQISVALRSATGQFYPVNSAWLTANPTITYLNKAGNTPQEKQAEEELAQAIQAQLGKLTNLNSTSTFTISASFQVNSADWNAEIKPNIVLHITTPDGKEITKPVEVSPLKETNQYQYNVQVSPKLTPDKTDEHVHYMNIEPNAWDRNNGGQPGVYNPMNQHLKSVTFKIHNPDPKNIKITPLDVPGLTVNPNGTYTISGNLINGSHRLFKVTTTTNNQLRETISTIPVSEQTESGININASAATVTHLDGGHVLLTQQNFGSHFTMSQTSIPGTTQQQGFINNANKVTYGSTMSTGVPGKYDVYTGSLVTNGQIVVSNANESGNLIEKGQTYCHLNDNAVNILKSGTPAEKAQIMEDIISGNMSGIGEEYTASQIQVMVNSGKSIPVLNFVYGEGHYTGRNYKDSASYQTAPLDGGNTPVISRTITFGKLVGNYTPAQQESMAKELKGGQLPSDGVVMNNGKLQGFILTPPNKYTDSVVQHRGIGQITDERYGDYSHGLSSARNGASMTTGVTIDNAGTGSSNTVAREKESWLNEPHQVNAIIQGTGSGAPLYFDNSTITIDMGHSFKINGPVEIGSVVVPASNYKIDGDKLVITTTPSMKQTLGSAPDIQFTAQYTNTSTINAPITASVSVTGPNSSDGMNYKYNNTTVPAQKGGMPSITNYKTVIVTAKTISNSCFHTGTPVKKEANGDLVTTLTDSLTNNNNETKTYYIAGELPGASSDNLPGNDGEPDVGGLTTQLQNLNTGGQPTWVLPKSALNAKNQALLASPTGLDLKDSLKYIESPNSGWIKYKPGMNLSNIVGYYTKATVKPNGVYNMTYKLKLNNIQNGTYQLAHSAFKYYDATDDIGSTSNIVSITPPGELNASAWNSVVKVVEGKKFKELPKAEQEKILKSLEPALKEIEAKLTGDGPDVDANFDNTPTKLMNEVTYANSQLQKLGFKLVSTTVNNAKRDVQWFQSVGIVNNTGHTEIVFNIEPAVPAKPATPEPQTTVKEVYSNGKPVKDVPVKTTSNKEGAKVDTSVPSLPKGYQVTKVTVNGKVVSQGDVPTKQSEGDQTIVYTIGKQPTDTVKVIEENTGKPNTTISIKTATGNTNAPTGLQTPEIPKGYHVVSITNGEGKEVSGVPKTFGTSDNTTIYTIAPNVKDRTYAQVVTTDGKVLVQTTQVGSGSPSSKEDVITPSVPKGYEITKVTIDGKKVSPNKDGKYEVTYNNSDSKEVDNHIVITVKHVPVQDTVKVMEGNKVTSTTTTTPGMPGTDNGVKHPTITGGYHIGSITVDGKKVDKVPKTYGDEGQTIVYHLVQNQPNKIEAQVETTTGDVLTPYKEVAHGPEGSEVTCDKTSIPEGYHLVKVEYNGKVISSTTGGKVVYMLPDTIPTKGEGKLTYVVAPNQTNVNVQVIDGTKTLSNTTTSGVNGDKITNDTNVVPKGYQIVNITVNGHTVSEKDLPKDFGKKDINIVYHVAKIPTGEVKQEVVTSTGTIIEEPTVVAHGEVGQDTNLKPYTPPKGYHIVKVVVNGKTLTTKEEDNMIHNLPSTITNQTQTVKYVIAKNVEQKGKIYIYVVNQNTNTTIYSGTISGNVGTPTTGIIPSDISGNNSGYKIQQITVNGTITPESGLPKTFTNGEKEVVYKVVSTNGSLTYKVFLGNHELRQGTLSGTPGTKASYGIPHNPSWQLQSVDINGKTIETNTQALQQEYENYKGDYEVNGNTIIYHYVEKPATTTPAPKTTPVVKPSTTKKDSGAKSDNDNTTSKDKTPSKVAPKKDVTPSKETPAKSTTPDKKTDVKTPSKDVTPKTEPKKDVTPTTGSKPEKPVHGHQTEPKKDVTPSKDKTPTVNHDNTTPDKKTEPKKDVTPNKDKTPSKETKPEVKPSQPIKGETPVKHAKATNVHHDIKPAKPEHTSKPSSETSSKDKTPVVNHDTTPNKDKGTTPSKDKTSTTSHDNGTTPDKTPVVNHNGEHHTTPVVNHDTTPNKDKGTTPSKDKTPTTNHDNGTTPDKTPVVNHNGEHHTTPVVNHDTTSNKDKGTTPSKDKTPTTNHDNGTTPDKTPVVNHNGEHHTTPVVNHDTTPNKDKGTTPSKDKTPTTSHDNGTTPDKTPVVNHNGEHHTTPVVNHDTTPNKNKGTTPSKDKTPTINHDNGTTPDKTPVVNHNGEHHTTPVVSHNDNKGNTAGSETHTSTSTHATVSGSGEANSSSTAHASANDGETKTSTTSSSSANGNEDTPVVKPVSPDHKKNTSKDNKGNTNKDKTPVVNHNDNKTDVNHNNSENNKGDNITKDNNHNTGDEVHTSKSTHTTVNGKGEVDSTGTASASANGGETKTLATANTRGSENTPVVNSNNGENNIIHVIGNVPNTATGSTSNSVTPNDVANSDGNSSTPFNSSSVNGSTGSNYTDNNLVNGPNEDDSTAQTVLPHTGLNTQGAEHTAKEAGAVAGIVAMLSGLFFFRRKK